MNEKMENASCRWWRRGRSTKLSRAKESKRILKRKASKPYPRKTKTETLFLVQSTVRAKIIPAKRTVDAPENVSTPLKECSQQEGPQEEPWREMSAQNSASLLRKGRVSNSQQCRGRQESAPVSAICNKKRTWSRVLMLSFLHRRGSCWLAFPSLS